MNHFMQTYTTKEKFTLMLHITTLKIYIILIAIRKCENKLGIGTFKNEIYIKFLIEALNLHYENLEQQNYDL